MTPRERATEAVNEACSGWLITPNDMNNIRYIFEQAIMAAENAAFKAGVEEEREACALVAIEIATQAKPVHIMGHCPYATDAGECIKRIRARKEGK